MTKDKIRNTCEILGVAPVKEKMTKSCLKRFGQKEKTYRGSSKSLLEEGYPNKQRVEEDQGRENQSMVCCCCCSNLFKLTS